MGAIATAGAGWRLRSTPTISLDTIACIATRAMQAELYTTPKPGLVDRWDVGAHRDMDYNTFSRAITAIAPAFQEVVRITAEADGEAVGPALFEKTRQSGLVAERAMFTATGGVNTHKGQIFVMVLLTTATAALRRELMRTRYRSLYTEEGSAVPKKGGAIGPIAGTIAGTIREGVRGLTRGIVERELRRSTASARAEFVPVASAPTALVPATPSPATPLSFCAEHENSPTNGERLFRDTGVTGVRGEAERGFPGIFEAGLPVFTAMRQEGLDRNAAAVNALLSIMTVAEDTTVLNRCGVDGLIAMRRAAANALNSGGITTATGREAIAAMNRFFIEENISPGGCADLLAGTFFVYDVVGEIRKDADSR